MTAVGDTLREQGLAAPAVGGGTTFLQAKTANEVLKAQERRIRLQKLKGELVDKARAEALMFLLARGAGRVGELACAGRGTHGVGARGGAGRGSPTACSTTGWWCCCSTSSSGRRRGSRRSRRGWRAPRRRGEEAL